ncbi:MAG: hypothetical protein IJZ51_04470 [Ruminiclostridium sp.]|nr:hypothetical protein [Ruminiclostridium sp.]
MVLDGISRVFLIAPDGRGKKTLISAIVHKCVNSIVKVNNELFRILPIEKEYETAEGSELIKQSLKSYHVLEDFKIDDAFRKTLSGEDVFSVDMRVGDSLCGRLEFYNIRNNLTDDLNESDTYGNFAASLIILDAEKIINDDNDDESYILNELEGVKKRYGRDVFVQIAISRTDIYFLSEADRDTSALKSKAVTLYKRLMDYIEGNCMKCSICPYSAANVEYNMVFDSNGNLLDNPDYNPWNIDALLQSIVLGSALVLDRRIRFSLERCRNTLRTRIGKFNKGNVRAYVDVVQARDDIGRLTVEHYPILNARRIFGAKQ